MFELFSAPVPVLEQQAPAPIAERYSQTIRELALAYEARVEQTGGDAQAGALALLERLRDDLSPRIASPRRGAARISQKARRRAVAALDRVIAEGRAAR